MTKVAERVDAADPETNGTAAATTADARAATPDEADAAAGATYRDLLVPPGTRLLHIGPPKTGTTTIQAAFHDAREASLAQGVRYAGRSQHSAIAVLAGTGRPSFKGDQVPPPPAKWRAFLKDIETAPEPRVVISSEFFADAEPAIIPRLVDELGRDRLHVVLTLRPLSRILPSQWQQFVKSGLSLSYDTWLDGIFNKPDSTTPTFWRRHHHHELAALWAAEVGAKNVTVIVINDRDHEDVLRVLEGMTGLREGTLRTIDDHVNRSMTLPEAEAVRAFNIAFRAEGLSNDLLHRVMNFGTSDYMKARPPKPEEPKVRTPQWALDRVAPLAREIVDGLASSGVRIVGDLERLASKERSDLEGDRNPEVGIPPDIAARMAVGMLVVQGMGRSPTAGASAPGTTPGRRPGDAPVRIEPPAVARLSTTRLLSIIAGRSRYALRSARFAVRRRLGRTYRPRDS